MADEIQYCIVCKNGSHRTDWKNATKDGKFVACDGHSSNEFAAAVKAASVEA